MFACGSSAAGRRVRCPRLVSDVLARIGLEARRSAAPERSLVSFTHASQKGSLRDPEDAVMSRWIQFWQEPWPASAAVAHHLRNSATILFHRVSFICNRFRPGFTIPISLSFSNNPLVSFLVFMPLIGV